MSGAYIYPGSVYSIVCGNCFRKIKMELNREKRTSNSCVKIE